MSSLIKLEKAIIDMNDILFVIFLVIIGVAFLYLLICKYKGVREEKIEVYDFKVSTDYVEEKSYMTIILVGKLMVPQKRRIAEKYLVTITYEGYSVEIDDILLYNIVRNGKLPKVFLVTVFNKNDKVVKHYLEIK